MCRIELRGVAKRFRDARVLNDIDLTIESGEFVVFIGPSGCGKSTLLRLIAGLDDVSEGEVEIDGRIVNDVAPAQRDIAMVFQSYALYPHMSVRENMAFGLRQQQLPAQEVDARVAEASRVLLLDALLDRKPRELSGGQRQRVAIGRAIVRKPKVFLFDEPLSNLDASLRVNTRVEIAKLHRQIGTASMVYVTHDQVEAMTLADKIVLLRPGTRGADQPSIAQVGSPLTLYHHPADRFVAGFIGSPSMNFIDGTLERVDTAGVQLRCAGLLHEAHVSAREDAQGEPVSLGIRPEHVAVSRNEGGIVRPNRCIGLIGHVEHLGEHSYVHVVLERGSTPVVAKVHDDSLAEGDSVLLHLPPALVHVFREDGTALQRVT